MASADDDPTPPARPVLLAGGEIILGGRHVPTPFPTRHHLDSGLTYEGRSGRYGPQAIVRAAPPELAVVHCTGDEEDGAESFFRNLAARGLSVEFHLDGLGRLWQFLDPLRHSALHVGGLNKRAVGIEVENPVRPIGSSKRPRSRQIVQVVGERVGPYPSDFVVKNGVRHYYRRSNRIACLGLWPAQLETLRALPAIFAAEIGIPARLADTRDYVPKAERGPALRGWIGHSSVHLGHGDPSVDALEGLF